MPSMVLILNEKRQIVAANETLLDVLHVAASAVLTQRPGEAVGCIHAHEGPDGCGTAHHCATCGAVRALLESTQRGEKVVRECNILVDTGSGVTPMDLRVTATPFSVGSDRFILTAIEDISRSNRLAVLQRAFFHDVLNTAGCIQGYARYFVDDEQSCDQEVCERLAILSGQLIETIQAQRDLIYAESGDFTTQPVPLQPRRILEGLRSQYEGHSVAESCRIELGRVWDEAIVADERLLFRVLGNMLKNALEATPPGGTVQMECLESDERCIFAVHNPGVMSADVQQQIFQRSFSTKGEPGRGIGAYSMKLFGERYLGGKVDFVSRTPDGTTFTLTLPKRPGTSSVV